MVNVTAGNPVNLTAVGQSGLNTSKLMAVVRDLKGEVIAVKRNALNGGSTDEIAVDGTNLLVKLSAVDTVRLPETAHDEVEEWKNKVTICQYIEPAAPDKPWWKEGQLFFLDTSLPAYDSAPVEPDFIGCSLFKTLGSIDNVPVGPDLVLDESGLWRKSSTTEYLPAVPIPGVVSSLINQIKFSGNENMFIGSGAISSLTGNYNIGLGANALGYAQACNHNIALGNGALQESQGHNNVAVGLLSQRLTSQGYENTSVGVQALKNNTNGNSNTAFGYNSLLQNTTGVFNTVFGKNAGAEITTGSKNTLIGSGSMFYITTGSNNVAMGDYAGYGNWGGSYPNIFNFTNNNSTFIGAGTKSKLNGSTNETVIGYGALGEGTNTVKIGNDQVEFCYLSGFVVLSTSSASPVPGSLKYDSGHFYGYDGSTWKQLDN